MNKRMVLATALFINAMAAVQLSVNSNSRGTI